jgi:NADPH2:quinone reductase
MTHLRPSVPRAVVGNTLGPPQTYRLRPADPGTPGPGEVRYAVHAAAVSYVDVLIAAGRYQFRPPVPFIPGTECAGVVERVGAGVTGFKPGDRVIGRPAGGAFREAGVTPAHELVLLPPDLSLVEGAAFKVSYTTAYHALVQRARLQAGETVLVLGAAGAIGRAAVQIAKALGARVIASGSSAEKRSLATAAGADVAIDATSSSWRDDLRDANGGQPVDVVVDPVGGEATEPAFRALAWNGRHLVIGFVGGGIPKLPTNLALLKGAALIGVDVRQFALREPRQAAENIASLLHLHALHDLRPAIGSTFALERFAEAMQLAASGRALGRVVLTMKDV